jgi:hypothetical protein
VFAAFLGAGVANVGADVAHFADKRRTAAHERDAQTTHFRAVKAPSRTVGHASQAGIGAVVALLGTTTACDDAGLMLLMRHDNLWWKGIKATPKSTGNKDAESGPGAFFGVWVAELFRVPPNSLRKSHDFRYTNFTSILKGFLLFTVPNSCLSADGAVAGRIASRREAVPLMAAGGP